MSTSALVSKVNKEVFVIVVFHSIDSNHWQAVASSGQIFNYFEYRIPNIDNCKLTKHRSYHYLVNEYYGIDGLHKLMLPKNHQP